MSTDKKSYKSAFTGAFAALAASSCCIPPVIAAIAGVGGVSSSLSWLEPLRPYLVGLAVIAIGYAWYAHMKPKKEEACCAIDAQPKWYQTKGYLVGITLFATLSLSFPYYSGIFFPDASAGKTIVVDEGDLVEVRWNIEGMTCSGCEHHVNQVLREREGVVEASSSHQEGMATMKFDSSRTSSEKLAVAVEEATGYEVTEHKVLSRK